MSESTNSVRLLLWDETDIAARLADVMVAKPSAEPAIDLGTLYRWLASRCTAEEAPQARLCAVVPPGEEESQSTRITAARQNGFGVVVKRGNPGIPADFSASILATIERARQAGTLSEVLVASHDADRLGGRLEDLASSGIMVTVLGFREKARYAAASARLGFVDLEEIPGIWNVALPRTDLFDLPDEGRELPPLALPDAVVSIAPITPIAPLASPAPVAAAAVPAAHLAASASVLDRVTAGLSQPPPPPPPPAFGSGTPVSDSPSAADDDGSSTSDTAEETDEVGLFVAARVAPPPPPNSIFRAGRIGQPNGQPD